MTETPHPDKLPENLLDTIAKATRLREGAAGVETVLRTVKRLGTARLNQVARQARLPLPVATAVRRELEKAGLLERGAGISLSAEGNHFVETHLGVMASVDVTCPHCAGSGLAHPDNAMLATFTTWLESAPPVDVTLDQAPCTAETSLHRAALMYRDGALEGRRILILGDDDSVSLALCLFNRVHVGAPLRHPITVIELDPGRAGFIAARALAEQLPIEIIAHDLREPLPDALLSAFDVVETDPPYTIAGAKLFLDRARQALGDEPGTLGYFSYAQVSGREQFELNRTIAESGFAITAMHPNFNTYQGASILGSVGQLMTLTGVTQPERPGQRHEGALYSAEVRPRVRRYRCRSCNTVHTLGEVGVPTTIEALKEAGCPTCGGHTFERQAGHTRGVQS